jgi:hypothetical protein
MKLRRWLRLQYQLSRICIPKAIQGYQMHSGEGVP